MIELNSKGLGVRWVSGCRRRLFPWNLGRPPFQKVAVEAVGMAVPLHSVGLAMRIVGSVADVEVADGDHFDGFPCSDQIQYHACVVTSSQCANLSLDAVFPT